MIETGTVLQNRYRIDKKIGQGGMGAVFVATDERFGSTVAIKETFFTDENYRRAFEREARLLNNLRHPALPRVSDHFTEENGQFLVMEYITGDDLSEKIEESNSPFPIGDVLNWADQLLDALDFLHTQETPVIHRDIKPQNLKLTPRGQIILLDFGLAKGSPTDARHQTAAQSVFGYSRNYASLEQIQGTGTDPRSDLYSLGATLYHLMTGIPPVDALTRAMTVLNGEEDPLPSADKIHKQVPAGVAEVLQRAMALNANHRPTSAVAMRAMLTEADKTVTADAQIVAGKKSAADLLSQNTEVYGKAPQSNQTKQSAMETEVLPSAISAGGGSANQTQTELPRVELFENSAENSIETQFNEISGKKPGTQVQTFANVTETRRARRGRALGAALGALVLIGSAAGAIYVFKPDVFQRNNFNNSGVEKKEAAANTPNAANNADMKNADTADTNAASNSSKKTAVDSVTLKKTSSSKSDEKSTAADSSGGSGRNNSRDDDDDETATTKKGSGAATVTSGDDDSDDDDEDPKDVKMNSNRIETKDIIIDHGKLIYKDANKDPRRRMPPNMKGLTPEQQRRIQQMIERNRVRVPRQPNKPPEQPR